jgi:hypothetical protein
MPRSAAVFGFGTGAGPPKYEFETGGVLPGEYLLVATVSVGGRSYRGVQRVVVNAGAAANPTGLRVDDLIITGVTQRPTLTVALVGNNVRLAWPASATGFVLQETLSLPGGWVNSADQGTVQGAEKVVTFTPPGPSKFYQLRQ